MPGGEGGKGSLGPPDVFPQELNQPEDEVSEQSNRDGFQPLFAVKKGVERKVGNPSLH